MISKLLNVKYWLIIVIVVWAGIVSLMRADPAQDEDPVAAFAGQWLVKWHDYPNKGDVSPAAYWIYRRTEDKQWIFATRSGEEYEHGTGSCRGSIENGILKLQHPYFELGHWGGESKIKLTGPDSAQGRWTYRGNGGIEEWRRVHSRIEKVVFHSELRSETYPGGPPGLVRMKWDRFWWGRINNSPINRPQFTIEVFGTDWWGMHSYQIEGCDALELRVVGEIKDPNAPNWLKAHIGRRMKVLIWYDSIPGRQYVIVDGQRFPFDLVIDSHPKAPKEPELRFLVRKGSEFIPAPAEGIKYGEVFVIEAKFPQPQSEPSFFEVELNWKGASMPESYRLERADDAGTLFRSDKLRAAFYNKPDVEYAFDLPGGK